MAKNLDIDKYVFDNDQFKKQVDNLVRSSLKLQVVLHQNKVTKEEFLDNLVKFVDLREYLENPDNCLFGYEIFRDDEKKLTFKKVPATKKIAELMNIQNNLWLSDISNINKDLRLGQVSLISSKQDELEKRMNMIKETFAEHKNISLKGVFAVNNDVLHSSKLAQALANEFAISNITTVYIKTQDLFKKLRSGFNDGQNQNAQILSILERADIVIFDELGNESANSWFLFEVISQILSKRVVSNKISIFFSNLSIKQLSNYYENHRTLADEKHKTLTLIQKIQESTIEINF
ncbi:ATP-binding protein [Mycoplasma sp. HS2188]|uniref:ATP-binding protein n=1 Tax=Mycoplasma sp. HS2188 TaxID=2976765 RepID=UPI0021AA29EB|nr:ATP-binding protein [Mycoplasma sp. HS2188]MCT4469804.1 ATP-binding protein [Mycoplasma sp. HS2188]